MTIWCSEIPAFGKLQNVGVNLKTVKISLTAFNKQHFIPGLILALLGLYWIAMNIELVYNYHFTALLYNFMYPDWVLVVNIILGATTFILGIKVINRSMNILYAYVIFTTLLLIVILIDR